jgi:hypothetical protein
MICTSKLNQAVYPNSETSKKVTYAGTKTEAIVNNQFAPYSVAMAIQDLNEIYCSGVSTDGRNHASLKLFHVVIPYFHKVHGIKSQLIDLNSTPNDKIRDNSKLCYTNTERLQPPYKACCILW